MNKALFTIANIISRKIVQEIKDFDRSLYALKVPRPLKDCVIIKSGKYDTKLVSIEVDESWDYISSNTLVVEIKPSWFVKDSVESIEKLLENEGFIFGFVHQPQTTTEYEQFYHPEPIKLIERYAFSNPDVIADLI